VDRSAKEVGELYCRALKPETIPETASVELLNYAARAAEAWLKMCGSK